MYLLKEGAKPVPENRKRRKIAAYCLPGEEPAEMQQQEAAEPDAFMDLNSFKEVTPVIKSTTRTKKPNPQ